MKPKGLHAHSHSLLNMSWKTWGYSWIAWIVMFYENKLPWHPIVTVCDGDVVKSFFQSPTHWETFGGSLIQMETPVISCRTLLNDRSWFHRACGVLAVSTQSFITTHWFFFGGGQDVASRVLHNKYGGLVSHLLVSRKYLSPLGVCLNSRSVSVLWRYHKNVK